MEEVIPLCEALIVTNPVSIEATNDGRQRGNSDVPRCAAAHMALIDRCMRVASVRFGEPCI